MTDDRTWWRGRGLGARWVSLEREEEPTAGPNFGSHSWMSFFPTARRSDEWRLLKENREGEESWSFFLSSSGFFWYVFIYILMPKYVGGYPNPTKLSMSPPGLWCFDAEPWAYWWRLMAPPEQKKQRPGGVFWMKVQRELHRTTTLKINQLRWCAWRGF